MALISPGKLRYDLYSQSENSGAPLVISVLASLIERTVARNERIAGRCCGSRRRTRVFDGVETPDMTIQSYLERIFRYTRAAPPVYVVAYVYIDRLSQNLPEFRIGAANVHRLLITTIMVASKYVEDMNYRNSYYAKVGGLSTQEMNKLEMEFLFEMKFKLHVNVSVFESYCRHLEREVSINGGYQIEKALRCAQEMKKTTQIQEQTTRSNYDRRIAHLLL
ncbi:cyclin-U2-1-like [Andrographis paniculata]|uniref:cyclin-U2-1-like n=1 Tax=Andrographis paniculata TaxID=175694 RepID=UPI0021E7F017|nr:cyclin-U2-1-like [Andrographis paniculata]